VLPFFNRITDAQIDEVCGNLAEVIELAAKLTPATKAASSS